MTNSLSRNLGTLEIMAAQPRQRGTDDAYLAVDWSQSSANRLQVDRPLNKLAASLLWS